MGSVAVGHKQFAKLGRPIDMSVVNAYSRKSVPRRKRQWRATREIIR